MARRVRRGARDGFRYATPTLRKTRERQAVGLNALAGLIGTPAPTLSRIESGKLRADRKRQAAIASALAVDVDELFAAKAKDSPHATRNRGAPGGVGQGRSSFPTTAIRMGFFALLGGRAM